VFCLSSPVNSINFDELDFIKLDGQDLSQFDCTENDKDEQGLQTFIQKEARPFQSENLGVTYLAVLQGRIVPFITVHSEACSVLFHVPATWSGVLSGMF